MSDQDDPIRHFFLNYREAKAIAREIRLVAEGFRAILSTPLADELDQKANRLEESIAEMEAAFGEINRRK